jgi:cell wall-associated NlpC family hydrolase
MDATSTALPSKAATPDNALAPNEDDYDLVDLPDPEKLDFDPPPPPDSEGDDHDVANFDPEPVAQRDAPIDAHDPFADPVVSRLMAASVTGQDDAAIVRRWLVRLRVREQLLAHARSELAAAHTVEERQRAKADVAKREAQVAYARRVIDNHRPPQTTVIERAVRAALLGHKHRDKLNYTQDPKKRWDGITRGRRSKNGQFPAWADCSSFVTWCYWDALGGPDAGADIINGGEWRWGNTDSQIQHGRKVSIAQARPGDLAFYTRKGRIGHVAIVVGRDSVVSHGTPEANDPPFAGPYMNRLNYDGTLNHIRRYVS